MSTIIYGIKNCDTMKKAIKWLTNENHGFRFHDYRKDGIDQAMVSDFINALGLDAVLNKRGTTYRNLSDEQKAAITEQNAAEFLAAHEAMIKRPILIHNGEYAIGFSAAQYQALFKDA